MVTSSASQPAVPDTTKTSRQPSPALELSASTWPTTSGTRNDPTSTQGT